MITMTKENRTIVLDDLVEEPDWPVATSGPDWLAEIHRAGAEHFRRLGVPSRKHEDWRITNITPLGKERLLRQDGKAAITASPEDLAPFAYPGLKCDTIVFLNGRFEASLSSIGATPDGVIISSLGEAIESHGQLVRAHLAKYVETEDDAFPALNTAEFTDGGFVYVPAGVKHDRPLHILNVTVADPKEEAIAHFPRNLFIIEENAEATIIEDYVCTDESIEARYFTNAVTEIYVGRQATARHYFTERESRGAYNISTLRVHQEEATHFESHSALFGAAIVRNNVYPRLAGANCHSLLNGIYFGNGERKIDNFMRVEHQNVHGESRQYYRGVLTDASQAAFSGRIVVAKGAQKTDAVQSNQNLLLSDEARAHSKPPLEIYADDVKCTHGATAGELDEEALFYLRSRGLKERTAKTLLVHAFAMESLERMSLEPVRDVLESHLIARLPGGETLRKYL